MNVANVIPLSATHEDRRAKSEHPAALNPARVRFGAFELDEANALLLRNGKAVTLAPKPFAVLCALARRPGSPADQARVARRSYGATSSSPTRCSRRPSAKCVRRSTTTRNSRAASRQYRGAAIASSLPRLAHRPSARPPSNAASRLGATIPRLWHSRHCAASMRRSPSSSVRSPPRWSASRSSSTSLSTDEAPHEPLRATPK